MHLGGRNSVRRFESSNEILTAKRHGFDAQGGFPVLDTSILVSEVITEISPKWP